jgi:site-specific recombinase XerD
MGALIKQFLLYCEGKKSPYTIRNYTLWLRHFWEYQGNKIPTIQDIEAFRSSLGFSVCHRNYHMSALRSLATFCKKYGYEFLEPDWIEFEKEPARQVTWLDEDETNQLLAQVIPHDLRTFRDCALLHFFLSTGLRVGEMHKLERNQINLKTREMTIIGKGDRVRLAFFDLETAHWLKQYLIRRNDESPALWVNMSGERISIVSIQKIVKEYAAFLGKKVTPHTLRHSYATKVYSKTKDIRFTQDMLGHKNIMTTQLYTHITDNTKRDIYDGLFPA